MSAERGNESEKVKSRDDQDDDQDWLFALSKGIDLWEALGKKVTHLGFNTKLSSIRHVTNSQERLFIILDDSFLQLLVILDLEKWRMQSFKKQNTKDRDPSVYWDSVVTVRPISLQSLSSSDAADCTGASDVWKIVVNQSGCLASLVGNVYFVVLSIYPTSMVPETKQLRTYWIQPLSQIADVKWHPLSPSFYHLAVLTVDGVLRLYNCSSSSKEPEQIFSFQEGILLYPTEPRKPPQVKPSENYQLKGLKTFASYKTTLSSEPSKGEGVSRRHNFVAMNFGTARESGWKLLAVYAVTSSGSIGIICGVVPLEFCLSLEDLRVLNRQSSEVIGPADMDNIDHVYIQEYWQLRLVQDLLNQVDMQNVEILYKPLVLKKQMLNMHLRSYRILPFAHFKPNMSITDIVIINLKVINIIAISSCNGEVYIGLDLTWIVPTWHLDEKSTAEQLQSSIRWLEKIELNTKNEHFDNIRLIYDERKCHLYTVSDLGVVQIDLSSIKRKVNEIFADFSNSRNNLSSQLFNDWPKSYSVKLYPTEDPQTCSSSNSFCTCRELRRLKLGFAALFDLYLDGLFVVLTDTLKLTGSYVVTRPPVTSTREKQKSLGILMPLSNKQRYSFLSISSMFQPSDTQSANSIVRDFNLRRLEYQKSFTLPALKKLSAISLNFSQGVINLTKAISEMNARMDLLEKELRCQDTICDFISKTSITEKHFKILAEKREKIKKLKSRQDVLDNHSFLLMKLALDSDNRLSQEELCLFSDLSVLNREINTSFRLQINQLYSKYADIRPTVEKIKCKIDLFRTQVVSASGENFSPERYEVLLNELKSRYTDIETIKKKLTRINQTLSQRESS